jgi:uncharacterized protein (TIGR02271 family)
MSGDNKSGNAPRPDGYALRNEAPDNSETVRLHAEELAVARERVQTGRVRVQVVTREHEELVDVSLTRENVEVERVAINRPVDAIPPTRQEGDTTIVPLVEEVLIVERRLILKEELHVRRVHATEQHRERVVLRHQEAVITRIPAETPDADPKGE